MTIYTSCFGNYDEILTSANVRYDETFNPYSGASRDLSDKLKAKLYKVLNPDLLDVWIDSNIEIHNEKEFLKLFSGDITIFKHPFNETVGEELALCRSLGHINDLEKGKIEELYKNSKFDVYKEQLFACGIIFRTPRVKKLNELWWSLICQYSYRDQLTFPYALKMYPELDVNIIDLNIYDNEIFKIHKHR